MRYALALLLVLATSARLAEAQVPFLVTESARDIPIAYEVDVVVAGGSSGAVAAAVAAAQAGRKVFLAAPRPYLGEDLCATHRLWLEEGETTNLPLARRIFAAEGVDTVSRSPGAMRFTYEASLPSAGVHRDTAPPARLSDGRAGSAETESVEYAGDVVLTADLGLMRRIKVARIVLFHRAGGDFNPESVTVQTSPDLRGWQTVATLACDRPEEGRFDLSTAVNGDARYARFMVRRGESAKRLLVGEIELIGDPVADRSVTPLSRGPVRPMHVKRTLDEALLAAKVPFLYSCYVTEILRDADGSPAGIVMANRAGRQAVLARVIIDATPRASVARMAGVRFTAYPAGEQSFKYTVIGGEPKAGDRLAARKAAVGYGDPEGGPAGAFAGYPFIEYTLRLPMADSSFASFARAEQMARDLTWDEAWEANTETIFQVPPDRIVSLGGGGEDWLGANSMLIKCFQPSGVGRIYVLGGCADLGRKAAGAMLRPLAFMETGTRIGTAAAAEARTIRPGGRIAVGGVRTAATLSGDVREVQGNVRPALRGGPVVHSPGLTLPVLGSYDVVVVGGGTGGAPAGIAAARKGAKVLVIEYLHGMGGVGTLGLISKYYWGYREGFTAEVPGGASWNPLHKAEWYRKTLRQAGGEIWFGVIGCGAFVDGGAVKGVVVATPDGRGIVLGKVVIDSTGNADIAAAAGAQTVHTGADELAQQGTGLPSVKLSASYTNTDFTIVDETDLVDVWHVLVYAKNKYPEAFDLGQLIDSRERRRIVGDFTMSLPDQVNLRTYPDTISIAYSNFDTHGYTVDPYLLLEHPEKKGITVNVPYRCLLPSGLEGMLVTGLGISVHRDAVPLTRMQPDIQNQGYAAGLIAATSARTGRALRSVDLPAIQEELARLKIIPRSALGAKDSYPLPPEKVAEAVVSAREGKGMAVIATHPERALPLLREAYRKAADAKEKLVYARILAALGDASGVNELVSALDAAAWDKGWNYTGMGQFGNSLSEVDTLIVLLGRTRDRRAMPAIVRKAAMLTERSEFSHHRAIALALETIGDRRAAGALAELLNKPGMRGHAITTVESARTRSGRNPNDNATRATSIRELSLARALFRCGDSQELGRKTLVQYTHDLRGHLARHAQAVLDENPQAPSPTGTNSPDPAAF